MKSPSGKRSLPRPVNNRNTKEFRFSAAKPGPKGNGQEHRAAEEPPDNYNLTGFKPADFWK